MAEPLIVRERLLMDPHWRFHLGEWPTAAPRTHGETYMSVKAGYAAGPAAPDFDDSDWRLVDLPHDFVVEQPFDPTANVSHGFKRGDIAYYRKTFTLPAEDLGKRLWIEFEGVFRRATVWLNGYRLGTHESGYTSFYFDITDVAHYGDRNVLVVRVDAREFEGWWYEGGGIYRHVWLTKLPAVHLGHWGVFVAPALAEDRTTAIVPVTTTIVNESAEAATAILTTRIFDPHGKAIAVVATEERLAPGENREVRHEIKITQPILWDITNPVLYVAETTLAAGALADRVTTRFGLRQIQFDPERGFLLNGRVVKLKGTCNHQDHAGVGIAVPDAVWRYRLKRLQEMGSNAYRCAHNPPAPELLDLCDELGILVMDENRHLSSAPWGLAELESMIRRDRNHPCIILWSMANEEPAQGTPEGARIVRTMIARAKQLDPTRPTITAMHGDWGGEFSRAHDVQGCNYSLDKLDAYHAQHPEHPMVASEQSSAVTTRGLYGPDPEKGYLSAYDIHAPEWGATAEEAWRAIATRPFVAGTFVWTGFDYRGEPTPYEWPCISSHFGIMDTCGFPKDNFYYYQAQWTEQPVLHLFPHWNWPGREGEEIAVWAHTNCPEVELFLNGRSLGRQSLPPYGHLEWVVPYEPGRLEAKGYRDGKLIAEASVETTGSAYQLRLTPFQPTLAADGEDVAIITCSVHDAQGRIVPLADNLITFHVNEKGVIIGVGNGDPSSHEPDKASSRRAFHGFCQLLVQSRRNETGLVVVTATAPGLLPACLEIEALPAPIRPYVP